MQETVKLKAELRAETGKQAGKLRKAGLIPAVLYGSKTEAKNLSVNKKEFVKVYSQAGESTLVQLEVSGDKPKTVLVHDVQHHFLADEPTHIDFYEVDMTKKIHTHISLVFSGDSKAVKDLGGVLVKNMSEIEVEALPSDLPHHIEVNISGLSTFEDSVKISDLSIDASKVKVLAEPNAIIAKVAPPRSDEELKQLEEKPVTEEVETVEGVVKEEKEEGGEEAKKEEKNEES